MQQEELLLTYDDYLSLPNDGKRYEVIEGELVMSPAPEPEHQDVLGNLFEPLRSLVRTHALGKIYCAPIDVVLSMTDIVQPDIVFIARDRLFGVKKKNIVIPPDLVIEILSPSTRILDRTKKKSLYERYGVKEYWIVDPEKKLVEVYRLQGSAYSAPTVLAANELLTSPLLPELSFPVQKVFEL